MQVVNEFLPEFSNFISNLDSNKAKWNELIPYYDEYLSKFPVLYYSIEKLNEDRERSIEIIRLKNIFSYQKWVF